MPGEPGDTLCLDFANTLSWRGRLQPAESLGEYGDLIKWSIAHGVIDTSAAARLRAVASTRPADARRVLRRALSLREAIYRLLTARSAGSSPSAGDLRTLDRAHRRAIIHRRLIHSTDGFEWVWEGVDAALDGPLWIVAHVAAETLVSERLADVRACADEECRWLFLDRSRNHSRRWCDMSDCGNRAKARRFSARRRERKSAGSS